MSAIANYLKWLTIAKGQRPRTVEGRGRILRRWETWCGLHGVALLAATYTDILEWMPDTIGPDARRNYLAALSGFYSWLVFEGHRADNPVNRVPRPRARKRLPRPISDEDAHHIWTAAPEDARVALSLAMLCGLRCQELTEARWEDIDWGTPSILLVKSEGAKGGRERRVVIPDALATMLKGTGRVRKHGWLARGPYGQGGDPGLMSQWLSRILRDELGVDASAHQLRHWYATTLMNRGANLRTVQEALGHASLVWTAQYTKVTISDQAQFATDMRP